MTRIIGQQLDNHITGNYGEREFIGNGDYWDSLYEAWNTYDESLKQPMGDCPDWQYVWENQFEGEELELKWADNLMARVPAMYDEKPKPNALTIEQAAAIFYRAFRRFVYNKRVKPLPTSFDETKEDMGYGYNL